MDLKGSAETPQSRNSWNRYYCLSFKSPQGGVDDGETFRITGHLSEAPGDQKLLAELKGPSPDSKLRGRAGIWYHFKIRVEDIVSGTLIQASVWEDGGASPETWQVEYTDSSPLRLTSGTVGMVNVGKFPGGRAVVEELDVQPIELLHEEFSDVKDGAHPSKWLDTVLSTEAKEEPALFHVANSGDNAATWRDVDDYPLVLHPLDHRARRFDGVQTYVAGPLSLEPGKGLQTYTVEAWVRLIKGGDENPILTATDAEGKVVFAFAIVDPSAMKLTAGENAPFFHVALTADGGGARLLVNGQPSTWQPSAPTELRGERLTIGGGSHGQFFNGDIKDVRIWKAVRSAEQIQDTMFQDLTRLAEDPLKDPLKDLVAYWPLGSELRLGKSTEINFGPSSTAFWGSRSGAKWPIGVYLGGPSGDRFPVIQPPPPSQRSSLLQPANVINFKRPGEAPHFPGDPQPVGPLQRFTVEVWFRVTDEHRTDQKQVVFQTGDGNGGIVIYVFGGELWFGGYNRLGKGTGLWDGTFLSTDRIGGGRWHHVAVVLDARKELRPDSFLAFLDGKLLKKGPGAQLTSLGDASHVPAFSVGAAQQGESQTVTVDACISGGASGFSQHFELITVSTDKERSSKMFLVSSKDFYMDLNFVRTA